MIVFISIINNINNEVVMDLRSLNTFIQVAELNSFSKAGEKLGYSQPTVSFHIKQLENELGLQLFERIGHTITLTDDGRNTLAYAQQICRLSDEMVSGKDENTNPKGTIHLAMADSLCAPLIIDKFSAFRKKISRYISECCNKRHTAAF